MAEKEERIYLFTDKIICENCKDWYEHIDTLDSPDCMECAPADFPYITRSEAIEKMAKAICLERHACISKGEMCGLCELWRNFSTHAEAALNALLGE